MKTLQRAAALLPGLMVAAIGGAQAEADQHLLTDAVTGCAVWSVEVPQPGEGISWAGACPDGKAAGDGVLTFWDKAGLTGRYEGQMQGGKLNGAGTLFIRDDETQAFHEYLGTFADGKPVGTGFLKTADGSQFIGELIDGIRHGNGILVTPEGWLVKGEIKDGEGVGTLVVDYETEDGERYFGQAENAKRHGFGVLVTANEDFYAGGFAEGVPDGPGIYQAGDGERYAGDFATGKPNGFGTSIDADGNVIQGRFINGEPDGTILVTLPDGTQTVTDWQAGGTAQ